MLNKHYDKEYKAEKIKQWREDHKAEIAEYNKQYHNTPMWRAAYLLSTYKKNDKKYNRGESDLTAQWIVDNIFSKPCAHCGKKGWKIIGCNRLDNSKPHTKNNVEPCCADCNNVLAHIEQVNGEDRSKPVCQYNIYGKLIAIYPSTMEAERQNKGFIHSSISTCYKGKRQTHKGFIWKYAEEI